MSLGTIAHLQYYFARTGLLDGKGGQLARKKAKGAATLDLSMLEASSADADSSYASMGSSPDGGSNSSHSGRLVESPVASMMDEEDFDDSFEEFEPGMLLDPTISTYNPRRVAVPKPPTIEELKVELETTLKDAAQALKEVRQQKAGSFVEAPNAPTYPNMPEKNTQGWYEIQGMHILDVVTLAIRAAKMYYTAHDMPDRLDMIKSERQVRTDLLRVMETLKQMGIRNFKGGMKDEEIKIMDNWIDSVWDILKQEQAIATAEKTERDSWKWLTGNWAGREYERELLFLTTMDTEAETLPQWTPAASATSLPTPFLKSMQDGLRLIKLHNAAVKKSHRRFGAIPTFHADTQKPYRCADNLRYWVKAAELRFEVFLSIDALGIQNSNSGPEVWVKFEEAILKWCRHVREEFAKELSV